MSWYPLNFDITIPSDKSPEAVLRAAQETCFDAENLYPDADFGNADDAFIDGYLAGFAAALVIPPEPRQNPAGGAIARLRDREQSPNLRNLSAREQDDLTTVLEAAASSGPT